MRRPNMHAFAPLYLLSLVIVASIDVVANDTAEEAATTATHEQAPPDKPSLYFMGLDRKEIDDTSADLVEDLVLATLLSFDDITVSSDRDIAQAIARAERAQIEGCHETSADCTRNVALALGARFAVSGTVANANGLILTELIVIDTVTGLPVGRERVDARTAGSLQSRMKGTVVNLLLDVRGGERTAVAEEPSVRAFDDWDVLGGAVMLGLSTTALLVVCSTTIVLIVIVGSVIPGQRILWGGPLLGAWALSSFGGALAAFATAVVVDLFAGAEISWSRAAIATLGGAALLSVAYPLVVLSALGATTTIGATILGLKYGFEGGVLYDDDIVIPMIATGIGVTAVLAAVAGVMSVGLSVGSFAVTEPSPTFGEE